MFSEEITVLYQWLDKAAVTSIVFWETRERLDLMRQIQFNTININPHFTELSSMKITVTKAPYKH